MADYTQSIDFSAKDALASGDPDKAARGADVDTELGLIATAIATKIDESREGQASGIATLNGSSVIPAGVSGTPTSGGGQLPEASLTALGAVELATSAEAVTGTDALRAITPATLEGWAAQNASILKDLSDITDPGADVLFGWDESDNAAISFTVGNGLSFTTTALGVTDVTAAATRPYKLVSGTWSWDDASLDRFGETAWVPGTDGFYVSDGGNLEVATLQSLALPIQNAQTTQTLAAADMSSVLVFTGTATLTIDEHATVDIPVGTVVVLVMDHATQELTVQADTGVTLQSIFHPGGTANASDKVRAGGMAALIHLADDVWQLSGDIAT